MTIEERLQMIIGSYALQVASLSTQLEQAQARVKELETAHEKPDEKKE